MKTNKSLFRSSTTFTIAIAIAAVAIYTVKPQDARMSEELSGAVRRPRIQTQDQPDSPLGILSVRGDSATAHVPQVELVIVNRGVQAVRAYTIRYQTISGHSKGGGMQLTSASSIESMLQPGHTSSATVGEGTSYQDPIKKIVVSVDFVELADGATWGPDEYNSNDRLAGQRAGAQQTVEELMNLLNKEGPLAVMQSIERNIPAVAPPPGHSPEWLNAFDGGVGAIRERLKTAYNKSGIGVVESELRRPFDASDWR
jgi:hypothetical protein